MLLDILIFGPVLTCILYGVRDGFVRKLVAMFVIVVALILAQLFMRDVGVFLAGRGGISHEYAPMYGFLLVFIGLVVLQAFLYRFLTHRYKIGGIPDRIVGGVLGFFEGMLLVSSLLYIFAMYGFPDRQTKKDSEFHKSVVNIAPMILDLTSTIGPEVLQKLEEYGTPESSDKKKEK
ncbi:MAG: CvpA family protein [Bacteroidetes bacterium]|nr:CvpA family protein [Bacteroidota bacterium]